MPMTEIESLLKLQELDMKWQALEKALKELPVQKQITKLEESLLLLRERLSNANSELSGTQREQKHEEWAIKDITSTINSISQKIYGGEVTNPREIENMRTRLNTLEANKAQLEDGVIQLMEKAEALETEIERVTSELIQKESELGKLTDERDQETADISAKIMSIMEDRGKLQSVISDPLLRKYEQLLKDRGGCVVVPVKGNLCGGCHVALPSSIVILAKPNNRIVRCESCGRILCWQE